MEDKKHALVFPATGAVIWTTLKDLQALIDEGLVEVSATGAYEVTQKGFDYYEALTAKR